LSAAERRIRLRRLVHRGISVRISIAVEVEAPHIEAGLAQSIAPRITVESVRDRERRGKGRAVDVENRPRLIALPSQRRQMAQKQPHSLARAFDPVVLLARIELLNALVNHHRSKIRLTLE
jgi:hypothetical protein